MIMLMVMLMSLSNTATAAAANHNHLHHKHNRFLVAMTSLIYYTTVVKAETLYEEAIYMDFFT